MKYMLDDGAYAPVRAHFDDAGIDLRTPEAFDLGPAGSDTDQYVVDLKVHVEIPAGYYGKLESKSGLMTNHGVCSTGGVIDSGFRGDGKGHDDQPQPQALPLREGRQGGADGSTAGAYVHTGQSI